MLKKVITFLFIVCLVLIGIYIFLFNKSAMLLEELNLSEVSMEKDVVEIRGNIISSGKSYRGYSYSISDGVMEVVIYGGLVTSRHTEDSFCITIKDDMVKSIKKIVMKNGDNYQILLQK